MRIRIEGVLVILAAFALVLVACGSRKESGNKKRASSSPGAALEGDPGSAMEEQRRVPADLRDVTRAGPMDVKDDEADEPPRKRLSCKQGCEKLRTLALARDKKLAAQADGKARARHKKARGALVARCNKECAQSPILAACLTHGDTYKHVFGCLSTPKPPPMTTPALAETKRRCGVFLAAVKTKSACDKLASLLTEVAHAFARVSNKGEFPQADERAIQRCIGKSVDVGKKRCKAHRPYKVAATRLLAATFKN